MKKSLLFLFAIIILAGCTTSTSPYKNDVLVQDQYVLTRANPFAGSTTTIRFYLRNFGSNTVPRADVIFNDMQGLSSTINCQNGAVTGTSTNPGCEFSNIVSLDQRYVSITINMPSADSVKSPIPYTITYQTSFDYSGSRRLIIPVIDDSQENQPKNKFAISDASVGPVTAVFEPPLGAISRQGNQQVTEYWGVKGDSFEVRMDFSQAVSSTIPTVIKASNVRLNLQQLNVDPKSTCDFNSGLASKFDITVGQSQVPLTCSFVAQSFNGAEVSTVVDVNYYYTFTTQNTESFTVMPATGTSATSGVGSNSGGGNIV